MESYLTLLIPALLGVAALRLLAMPIGWMLKTAVHAAGGFLCLLLLNAASGLTGIYFPVNAVTVAVSGFLGIPGIALLALLELVS